MQVGGVLITRLERNQRKERPSVVLITGVRSFNRRYREAEECVAYRLIRSVLIYQGSLSPRICRPYHRATCPIFGQTGTADNGNWQAAILCISFIFYSASLFSPGLLSPPSTPEIKIF